MTPLKKMMLAGMLLIPGIAPGCAPESGDFAAYFSDQSCITLNGAPVQLGSDWTVEALIRAEADPSEGIQPIVVIGAAAMLWTSAEKTGFSSPTSPQETGWQTGYTVADGTTHHLAATWSHGNGGNIFFDGIRTGSGAPWNMITGVDTFQIGCDSDQQWQYSGAIDEVRISNMVRYPTNFYVLNEEFEPDEYTVALWHLNEGGGKKILDANDAFHGTADSVEWVPTLLSTLGEDTDP